MAFTDLFDRNAYWILGVGYDSPSKAVNKAYAKAQRARRANPKRLNEARDSLHRVGRRLAIDALTLTPQLEPAQLLAATVPAAEPPNVAHDPIDALLLVPAVELHLDASRPALVLRQDLVRAEPIVAPEIEK